MPEFVRVASMEDLPEDGSLLRVDAGGDAIVLARWEGEIFALEDRCSHQDFPLSDGEIDRGGRIECVLHGAKFDLRTGRAVQLPAIAPVRTYPVEVRDDGIYLEVEG